MHTGFAWAALIALGVALLAKMVHYGYHLYKWFVSETPNSTFDTSMAVVAALCVVVAFFLLVAALALSNFKVQNISQSSTSNRVIPSKLYQPRREVRAYDTEVQYLKE